MATCFQRYWRCSRDRVGRFFVLDVASGELPAALAGKRLDVVISTEVIEHLYDPRGFIAFVRRILQSGGGRVHRVNAVPRLSQEPGPGRWPLLWKSMLVKTRGA